MRTFLTLVLPHCHRRLPPVITARASPSFALCHPPSAHKSDAGDAPGSSHPTRCPLPPHLLPLTYLVQFLLAQDDLGHDHRRGEETKFGNFPTHHAHGTLLPPPG